MSRRKITLRLNSDVVERAKKADMNISYFLEVKLVEYLALLNGTPRRRFELIFTSKKYEKKEERGVLPFARNLLVYHRLAVVSVPVLEAAQLVFLIKK